MKDFIVDPATGFNFMPADFVPFKEREICERVRKMSGKELEQREPWWHPEFNVKVMMNPHPVLIATLFERLKAASEAGKTFTMILGNPEPFGLCGFPRGGGRPRGGYLRRIARYR